MPLCLLLHPSLYCKGVTPVSLLNNLEKNDGFGKFSFSDILFTGVLL